MTVFITVGIPASGKSTWARNYVKENDSAVIVCRDDIRNAHGLRSGQNENFVTKVHRLQMEAAFLAGLDVIVADTNINPKFRKSLIKFCHEHGQEVEVVPFPISLDEAILRDSKRDTHMVGADVVTKFYNDLRSQGLDDEPVVHTAPYFSDYRHDPSKRDAIVVDIDGTIARHVSRSPYDYTKVGTDEPIKDVIAVVGALADHYRIIFVSGREDSCRDDTADWIYVYLGIDVDAKDSELLMRATKDMRPDYIVKAEIYDNHVIPNYNIVMAFDDRDQVVRHVRARGITVAQVNYGRF